MSDPNQIRINELARELEIKAKVLIEFLPEIGVTDKKTHSSSLDLSHAELVRKHFRELAEKEAAAEAEVVEGEAAPEGEAAVAEEPATATETEEAPETEESSEPPPEVEAQPEMEPAPAAERAEEEAVSPEGNAEKQEKSE